MEMVSNGVVLFEPLWSAILLFFDTHKIDIQYLYTFIGLFYLLSLFYVLGKVSKTNNLFFASYMIGLFFLDVVQLRFTLALSFILWGVFFLYKKERKQGVILFFTALTLAMTVHLSSIVFVLLFFAYFLNIKKTITYTIIAGVFLFISYSVVIDYFGDLFDIASKVQRIGEGGFSSSHAYLTTPFSGLLVLFLALIAKKNLRQCPECLKSEIELAVRIAILSLLCVPLINFSPDIRRHIYFFFMIVAAIICGGMSYYRNKRQVCLLLVFISFAYFVLTVFTGNRDSVFFPLFNNNMLLGS